MYASLVRPKTDAHTVLAAGGINAALGNLDKEDSWEQHFIDTYFEGYGIGDPLKVEIMAKESPSLVKEIDKWGANFAKLKNGELDQRFLVPINIVELVIRRFYWIIDFENTFKKIG